MNKIWIKKWQKGLLKNEYSQSILEQILLPQLSISTFVGFFILLKQTHGVLLPPLSEIERARPDLIDVLFSTQNTKGD